MTCADGPTCPDNYIRWSENNMCYLHLPTATWESGNQTCVENGGHLASIHSEEENTFVAVTMGLSASYTYFGLFHNGAELVWTDGTPIDYTNYGAEPSSSAPYGSISESGVGVWGPHGDPQHTHSAVCKMAPVASGND